jgi:adenosylmethionine-8-amino-7-oxononanoate aminotransferase
LFGGFTHEPAIEVAEGWRFCQNQKKYSSDNGSTAVEVD